jgi:hypothetical protein
MNSDLPSAPIQEKDCKIVTDKPSLNSLSTTKIRNNIWVVGIHSGLFGIVNRGLAVFTGGYLSVVELRHFFLASLILISWLYLKPEEQINSGSMEFIQKHKSDAILPQHNAYLYACQVRMLELKKQHMVSQEYILPFSYICQIYHLLNLKHLETIHGFSLNNLKVIGVNNVQTTSIGGKMKFQTVLDSPYNLLRIWRQPIVEVDLILHTPYMVELSIPVYGDRRITVIFNALPINENEHRFFIDIYSNLPWPKPVLQVLLHFAACLTLFEDLPYLQKLAKRNIDCLLNANHISNHETMWLFKRFADLYGSRLIAQEKWAIDRAIFW